MTAIVGVINSQGIAIAADSAVTVSGINVKKVYNRSNKIFTLSKFHPVGISIYNLSDFMGMPLETLIKVYRKQLKDKYFPTLTEYKADFLIFMNSQLKHVDNVKIKNSFYQFCSEAHFTIINRINSNLNERKAELDAIDEPEKQVVYNNVIDHVLIEYHQEIVAYEQGNYLTTTIEDYIEFYKNEITDIELFIESELKKEFNNITIQDEHKVLFKKYFLAS